MPRLFGEGLALEMNLVGIPIGADEALRLGLVNEVVPDHELFDTSLSWARTIGIFARSRNSSEGCAASRP